MERGPPNMTVSPTPECPGYYSNNSTDYNENKSLFKRFLCYDRMNIPSLLIALLGLLGNGAVLWLLGFRIPRNHFSVYILNLAAADALFLCGSFLKSIHPCFGKFRDLTWVILFFLKYLFYTVGLSLRAAISTERCLCALFPLWYRCRRPEDTSAAVCAVLWALIGTLWLLSFVLLFTFYEVIYIFLIAGARLLLLTPVLCVSSLTLLLRVQCSSRRRRPPRLYLLVMLTVLMFLLCGLPWGVLDFMNVYFKLNVSCWPYDALACVNSSVNPLIYFFVGRLGNKRREPLREVLQRALGDEQELGGGTTNTPHTSNQEITV
ncbi:mas-related G-protein coupled receptor member A-like [Sarcophilus harrisii]|uniref:G-protein coupled receptors family 1 profile domain-containing protein n=1 Tax=Sarcophilus harrisii TaxID=9305 RepID=A0A7N4PPG3_SARHA|nr:mas-related G-protein coupled receptor member A-like [Sarcophilus harrisii]